MMLQVLADAEARPDLFVWAGQVGHDAILSWASKRSLVIRSDLLDFLARTGGGDAFESGTILHPFGGETTGDNADQANEEHRRQGLPPHLWLFHVGLCLSAVRQPTGDLVVLDGSYSVNRSYESLDDWYIDTLRAEFAERYALAPAPDDGRTPK